MNDTFVARLEATLGRPLGPKRLGRKPVTVHGFSDEKAQQNGVLLNAGAILDPHFSRPGGKTVAIRPVFWGFTPVNGYGFSMTALAGLKKWERFGRWVS